MFVVWNYAIQFAWEKLYFKNYINLNGTPFCNFSSILSFQFFRNKLNAPNKIFGLSVLDFEFELKFLGKTLSIEGKSKMSKQDFEFGKKGEGYWRF